MSILTTLTAALPADFTLTHLILLDPCWQANIRTEDGVAAATGDTIEEAIDRALAKALAAKFVGTFHFAPLRAPEAPARTLFDRLGFKRAAPAPLNRRA